MELPKLEKQLLVDSLGYSINYASSLVRTGKNYYDSKLQIPEGVRISTAGEEVKLYRSSILSTSEDFKDAFQKNSSQWHAQQWTATALRVPYGADPNRYESDSNGRKYWRRIVLVGDREMGEAYVPEGNGRTVSAWDTVYGIPRTTIEGKPFVFDVSAMFPSKPLKHYPAMLNNARFWFEPAPASDPVSGRADVAIMCCGYRCKETNIDVMTFDASKGRTYVSSDTGFRPVSEIRSESGLGAIEKTLAQKKQPELPQAPAPMQPQAYPLTDSMKALLRATEPSYEMIKRKLMERPIDDLLRQMREPPRWHGPYRS